MGIEKWQERMELVAQPRGLSENGVALVAQQIKHSRVVLKLYSRKPVTFLPKDVGDRTRIAQIVLVLPASGAAAKGSPARIHFENSEAMSNKPLGETATIAPRAFHADSHVAIERGKPGAKVLPTRRIVRDVDAAKLLTLCIESDSNVELLVGVDTNRYHICLLRVSGSQADGPLSGLAWDVLLSSQASEPQRGATCHVKGIERQVIAGSTSPAVLRE